MKEMTGLEVGAFGWLCISAIAAVLITCIIGIICIIRSNSRMKTVNNKRFVLREKEKMGNEGINEGINEG